MSEAVILKMERCQEHERGTLGVMLARVSIGINGCGLTINGVKIYQGHNKPYLSFPHLAGTPGEAGPACYPLSARVRQEVEDQVIALYEKGGPVSSGPVAFKDSYPEESLYASVSFRKMRLSLNLCGEYIVSFMEIKRGPDGRIHLVVPVIDKTKEPMAQFDESLWTGILTEACRAIVSRALNFKDKLSQRSSEVLKAALAHQAGYKYSELPVLVASGGPVLLELQEMIAAGPKKFERKYCRNIK